MDRLAARVSGIMLEAKRVSSVVHYRLSVPFGGGEARVNAHFRIALIVGATSLLCPTLPTRADHGAANPAAMLRRAAKLEDLRADGSQPFTLRARIAGKLGQQNLSGSYSLTWVSENRWHEELTVNGFKRVRDGAEGGYRQVSTADYKPLVIFELEKILNVAALAHLNPGLTAQKARPRDIAGVASPCVEIRWESFKVQEACFDPESGLLARAEFSFLGEPREGHADVAEFSGMLALGDREFPSQIRLRRPDGTSVDVSVDSLDAASGNADSLPVADPARSEFWRICKDGAGPKPIHIAPRISPLSSELRNEPGLVLVYAQIETDGTPTHVRVLQTSSPALERAALDELSHSRYEPRTCGGKPVRSEMMIGSTAASNR